MRNFDLKYIYVMSLALALFVGGFGTINKVSAIYQPGIIISEFSSTTEPEWVGIRNTSENNIDVTGWKLTELTSPDLEPTENDLVTLSGEIKAGYTLIVKVGSNKLNNTGDSIGLYDNSTEPILFDRVTYGNVNPTNYPTTAGLETGPGTKEYSFKISDTWNTSSITENTAKSEVSNAYSQYTETDYSPENWNKLIMFKNNFYEDSELATNLASLETFKVLAIDEMANIKTISETFTYISEALLSIDIINNLNTVTSSNYSSFAGLYFEKRTDINDENTAIGRITFNQIIDLSSEDIQNILLNLDNKIDIIDNHIEMDSNIANILSEDGANISFYRLSSNYQPILTVKDDSGLVLDQTTLITDITYTDSTKCNNSQTICKTLSFNTAHFTQFDLSDPLEMIMAVNAINGANFTNIASVFSVNAFALGLDISESSDYFYLSDKTIVHNSLVEQGFMDGESVKSTFDTAVSNQKIAEIEKSKLITNFNIEIPSTITNIDESTHTISISVPYGTDIISLTPTIVITGNSVSPASGIPQNFTAPVKYTVTALDSSTQEYEVTIKILKESQVIQSPTVNLVSPQNEIIIDSNTGIIINTPITITDATLNISALISDDGTTKSALLPSIKLITNTTLSENPIKVEIPENTKVTAPSEWSGIINIPTIKENSSVKVKADEDKEASVNSVLEIGYNDTLLIFDKGIRILIPGKAGMDTGYFKKGVFVKIENVCISDSQLDADSLPIGGDCKINIGDDLIIWTKHFTKFTTYTQTISKKTSTSSGSYVYPLETTILSSTYVNTPEIAPKNEDSLSDVGKTPKIETKIAKAQVKEISPMTVEFIDQLPNEDKEGELSTREKLANSLAASVAKTGSILSGPMSIWIIILIIIILLGGGYGFYSFDLFNKDTKRIKDIVSKVNEKNITPKEMPVVKISKETEIKETSKTTPEKPISTPEVVTNSTTTETLKTSTHAASEPTEIKQTTMPLESPVPVVKIPQVEPLATPAFPDSKIVKK